MSMGRRLHSCVLRGFATGQAIFEKDYSCVCGILRYISNARIEGSAPRNEWTLSEGPSSIDRRDSTTHYGRTYGLE